MSAVSVVVDVSSADSRQQCPSNGRQRTLEYGPLNPAGSGRQPSGIKHENRQSVARGNLRNRTSRRSRPCVGLERTVICTALWKAKRIARRTCAVFCPAVRRQAHNLRPHPESSPYVRHSREFADDAAGPNRLDGGEIFEGLTVEFFFFSFWPPPFPSL